MRILLTGATGLIGGRLLAKLTGRHEVIALVRRPMDHQARFVGELVVQDLSRPFDAARLPRQVDAVVHLAQSHAYREFPESAQEVFAVNTQSTLQLLDYALRSGAKRFVYASSGGVCGLRWTPIRHDDVADPSTFYLRSKYCGEVLADAYRELIGVTILRYFFVFGEGQKDGLVPRLIQSVISGEPIPLAGPDGIRVSLTYVENAAEATAAAVVAGCEGVLNVAGPEVWSIRAIAECLASTLGMTAAFKPNAVAHGGDLVADTTRLTVLMAGQYRRPIAEALRTVARDSLLRRDGTPTP